MKQRLADLLPIKDAIDPGTGRYDAKQLAALLDWPATEIAQYLERSPTSIASSPMSAALQDKLGDLAALYRDLVHLFSPPPGGTNEDIEAMRVERGPLDPHTAARTWLRTPIRSLDHTTPKARILRGEFATIRKLVDGFQDSVGAA